MFGLALLIVTNISIYLIFLRIFKEYAKAFVYFFVISSSMSFLFANILSCFNLFNKTGLIASYSLLLIASLFIQIYLVKSKGLKLQIIRINKEKAFIATSLIISVTILLIILRALCYPPINNDSIAYHLVRAFYYYKEQKVTNIPSNYVVMNYSGPANAIFVAQLFAMTGGSELGINLIQLPAMLAIGGAVFYISKELNCTEIASVLAAGLSMMLPLVILQAATTQNDLLSASFAVCTVYFLYISYREMKIFDILCAGFCIGGVVLCKISELSAVFPFFVIYIFAVFRKYKWYEVIKKNIFSIVSGLAVVSSFWIRNAMDLNGDFMAIGPSLYMNKGVKFSFVDYVGKIITSTAYCCCGYVNKINKGLLWIARRISAFIGAKEHGNWDCYYVTDKPNYDFFPFGITLILALVCFFIILFKKLERKHKTYAVIAMVGFVFGIIVMPGNGFIQSITRYMMGNIVLCMPMIAIVFDDLCTSRKIGLFSRKMIILMLLSVMCINSFMCNCYDMGQSIKGIKNTTYEEKRDGLAPRSQSWAVCSSDIKKYIDNCGARKIGVYDVGLTHIYTMLHELRSKEYEVKSIYGDYGAEYRDKDFTPDIIIWTDKIDKFQEQINYNDATYKAVLAVDYLLVGENLAVIYSRIK